MENSRFIDYVLTEEEIKKLPKPLREQREAYIDHIRNTETKHPSTDNSESVTELSNMVVARTILDEVTRRILFDINTKEENEEKK